MTSESAAVPAPVAFRRNADWWLAVLATLVVLALHVYFIAQVGGLWRDEVNSLNLAQGNLSQISHDSFPVLFPLLLRGWSDLGLAHSDVAVRCLGLLTGLCLTAVFWVAAWWTRRAPPIWSLALMALNAWVIYYAASLRAYGLGSAMIALCAAAGWRFVRHPGPKTWLIFAIAAVLSVQALYQNSVLVAGVCAGACAVVLRRKQFKLAGAVFLAGLTGAVSLLPYLHLITGMARAASPLEMTFDHLVAFNDLDTLLAYPLPQFFWVWTVLVGLVLLRGAADLFVKSDDGLSLYASVTIVVGVVAFVIFLWLANFPVQPWYFLPPVAMAMVCLEASLPRPAGRFRSVLWGGLAATAAISALFAVRVLDYRFTNVDLLAKKVAADAGKHDLVVVTPWQIGITFDRYYYGTSEWTTVPPISDHATHRYDLLEKQMQNTNVMRLVLKRVAETLNAGDAVWVVGGINDPKGTNAPVPLPPPPLPASGWNETPYRFNWNDQLGWLLRRDSTNIECLDKGQAENVNLNERLGLWKVTGWKD
jgi:hypothetical protein